jgi:hypothetical protein
MQETSKVPIAFTPVKKGESGLLPVLNHIKTRGNAQVLILGGGVRAFYQDKDLVPSILGEDWTTFVPPDAPVWEQLQRGLMQFSALIQENATTPRVGIFMAPPDFVNEHLFLPSKSGPYQASIYWIGLPDRPLTDMGILRKPLSREYIQSPWLEYIFSADDNKLRMSEQEELNNAIITQTNLDEILSRILQSLQDEMTALQAHRFAEAAKKVTKKWWQFWR